VVNQRWRPETGSAYEITCCAAMRDSNKIPKAMPMFFLDRATRLHLCEYCPISGWVVYQRWWPVSGSEYIPYIYHKPCMTWKIIRISPVVMLDAKKISISLNPWPLPVTDRHLSLLTHPDTRQCFDQSCCLTSKTYITVIILMVSCVQAEIYVISYLLPIPGRHLWFFTHPTNGSV